MSTMPLAQKVTESVRSEKRINAAVIINLFFKENASHGVSACTYEISRNGIRIPHVSGITGIEQQVWVQRQMRKAKYRVIWIGEPGTETENQVGLALIDGSSFIWDDSIRSKLF